MLFYFRFRRILPKRIMVWRSVWQELHSSIPQLRVRAFGWENYYLRVQVMLKLMTVMRLKLSIVSSVDRIVVCSLCVLFFTPTLSLFFTQWHTLRHYSSRQQKNNKMNMLLMPRIVFAGRSHLVLLLFVRFFTNVVATATEASNTMVVMHQY